jgi:8-oxo-dGTP diphosphatase
VTAGPRRARGRGPDDADEARFLAAYDPSLYERLSVAVDVVLVSARDGDLRTLVVRRAEHPDRGRWALPGTFVQPAESLEQAAERALRAKAGLTDVFLEQLYTFGLPGRDPRTRVISVAYYALVEPARFAGVATHGRPPGERPADAGADEVLTPRIHVPW